MHSLRDGAPSGQYACGRAGRGNHYLLPWPHHALAALATPRSGHATRLPPWPRHALAAVGLISGARLAASAGGYLFLMPPAFRTPLQLAQEKSFRAADIESQGRLVLRSNYIAAAAAAAAPASAQPTANDPMAATAANLNPTLDATRAQQVRRPRGRARCDGGLAPRPGSRTTILACAWPTLLSLPHACAWPTLLSLPRPSPPPPPRLRLAPPLLCSSRPNCRARFLGSQTAMAAMLGGQLDDPSVAPPAAPALSSLPPTSIAGGDGVASISANGGGVAASTWQPKKRLQAAESEPSHAKAARISMQDAAHDAATRAKASTTIPGASVAAGSVCDMEQYASCACT